jgi:hypothetical protein
MGIPDFSPATCVLLYSSSSPCLSGYGVTRVISSKIIGGEEAIEKMRTLHEIVRLLLVRIMPVALHGGEGVLYIE